MIGPERRINVFVPKIGHGNPWAAREIAGSLTGANLSELDGFFIRLLRRLHQLMTTSQKASETYTERSPSLRSLGQWVIASLMALDMIKGRLAERLKEGEINIFIQEFGLLAVAMLGWVRLRRGKNYLFIPDVYPKESALKILGRTGVGPIVWNRSADEELREKGFNPLLAAPVLPNPSQEQINKAVNQKKIVLKASGSGINRELLNFAVGLIEGEGRELECWLPWGIRIYSNDGRKTEEKISDRGEYFERFAKTLTDAGVIICYPSEMIQVIAALEGRGWDGEVMIFPPRGAHEKRNLEWARAQGLVDYVCERDKDGLVWKQVKRTQPPRGLGEELGKTSVPELLASRMLDK